MRARSARSSRSRLDGKAVAAVIDARAARAAAAACPSARRTRSTCWLHRRAGPRDDRRPGSRRCARDSDRDAREVIRDEPLMRSRIARALADGPAHRARARRGRSASRSDEVMFWMMGLRKYGHVAEVAGRRRTTGTSATRRSSGHEHPRQPRPRRARRRVDGVRRRRLHELRRLHRDVPARARPAAAPALPLRRCSGWRIACSPRRETVFSCLLCRACEESCPAGVHITENVRVAAPLPRRTAFGL